MHIITRKALLVFAESYPDAAKPLDVWYRIAKQASWQSIADVKKDFPHADAVGKCTVFNIGGNKYRLIAKILYPQQRIYVRFVLTHSDYDKGVWKNDCK